ncbi:hypothetical protein CCY99_07550 [Helicobacter sp. 16-1353]|uniref:hypothetical protein n=1 Tax=Helicobacter sp. 16-1353 TaxID=2004996 RepID=UPI000DCC00BE|nr:hypothetical protein [Helicobacter sp. 16-1353]RAX52238.1 hypothetical protein CCY99_07550 [Helicobacter sp. 16-1353]
MKKMILICCVAGLTFGQNISNDSLAIEKNFVLNKKIEPSYLFADIRIESSSLLRNIGELNDNDRKSITSTLNTIIVEAKKDDICKGGSYSINPIVNYDKNDRKTIGQNVDFTLNCKFLEKDGLAKYNDFLSKINKILSSNRLLTLPQPSIAYRITDDEINAAKETLFGEFLSHINSIETKYSTLAGKKCVVNSISTSDDYIPSPMPRALANAKMESSNADSTTAEAPIANEANITININLRFICK